MDGDQRAAHTVVLVVKDGLYTVSDNGGDVLQRGMGDVYWTKRLAGDFRLRRFADGRIYFQNEAGTTYVVKAGTVYELLATNDIEERTLARWSGRQCDLPAIGVASVANWKLSRL